MKASYSNAFGCGRNYSRSRRAQIAEFYGKEPATRAAKTWGFKSAKAMKKWIRSTEWHHVGRYANIVDYYNVEEWIKDECLCLDEIVGLSKDLTKIGIQKTLAPLVARIVRENLDNSFKSNWIHQIESKKRFAAYKLKEVSKAEGK